MVNNKYLTSLILHIILSIFAICLTIYYFVNNEPLAFGISLSFAIFSIFNTGYKWNDYSAMAFLIKTMKENIEDLKNLIRPEQDGEE